MNMTMSRILLLLMQYENNYMHALRKVFNYKIEQIEDQNDYIIDIIQI